MNPKEILIEAKRLLETKGWCQGAYAKDINNKVVRGFIGSEKPAAYCPIGAICQAQKEDFEIRPEATGFLRKVLDFKGRTSKFDVIDWNDLPGRTKEEVLQAFDKAIELADTQQTNQQGSLW